METIMFLMVLVIGLLFLYQMVIEHGKENNIVQLELAPLGIYTLPKSKEQVDLSHYYLDNKGNLYSINRDTWEINHQEKRDILICSNDSLDKSNFVVNSLRATNRKKVTIRRKDLNFKTLKSLNGSIRIKGKKTTQRHINIL